VCFIVRKTISELKHVILTTLFMPVQKKNTDSKLDEFYPNYFSSSDSLKLKCNLITVSMTREEKIASNA
jgi:hypothetical protein